MCSHSHSLTLTLRCLKLCAMQKRRLVIELHSTIKNHPLVFDTLRYVGAKVSRSRTRTHLLVRFTFTYFFLVHLTKNIKLDVCLHSIIVNKKIRSVQGSEIYGRKELLVIREAYIEYKVCHIYLGYEENSCYCSWESDHSWRTRCCFWQSMCKSSRNIRGKPLIIIQ